MGHFGALAAPLGFFLMTVGFALQLPTACASAKDESAIPGKARLIKGGPR